MNERYSTPAGDSLILIRIGEIALKVSIARILSDSLFQICAIAFATSDASPSHAVNPEFGLKHATAKWM